MARIRQPIKEGISRRERIPSRAPSSSVPRLQSRGTPGWCAWLQRRNGERSAWLLVRSRLSPSKRSHPEPVSEFGLAAPADRNLMLTITRQGQYKLVSVAVDRFDVI